MYETAAEAATRQEQVPPMVHRLAIASRLGPLQKIYYGRQATLWYRAMGGICLLVGALLTALFSDIAATLFAGWSLGQSLFVLMLGLAWIGVGIWLMITSFLKKRTAIFVYVQGLIVQRRGVEALRWEHLEKLWKIVHMHDNDVAQYSYTVQRADGERFVFNSDLPNVEALGKLLEEQLTSRVLPVVLSAYQADSAISFGALTLNQQGIETRKRTLPWSQVKHVYIDDTTVRIYKQDEVTPALTLASAKLANLNVLKTLIDYVRLSRTSAPEATVERMYLLFQAGLPLKFGVLSISNAGVTVRDELRLPWHDIESIELDEHEAVVVGKNGEHLQSVPLAMLDNVSGLKALLMAL